MRIPLLLLLVVVPFTSTFGQSHSLDATSTASDTDIRLATCEVGTWSACAAGQHWQSFCAENPPLPYPSRSFVMKVLTGAQCEPKLSNWRRHARACDGGCATHWPQQHDSSQSKNGSEISGPATRAWGGGQSPVRDAGKPFPNQSPPYNSLDVKNTNTRRQDIDARPVPPSPSEMFGIGPSEPPATANEAAESTTETDVENSIEVPRNIVPLESQLPTETSSQPIETSGTTPGLETEDGSTTDQPAWNDGSAASPDEESKHDGADEGVSEAGDLVPATPEPSTVPSNALPETPNKLPAAADESFEPRETDGVGKRSHQESRLGRKLPVPEPTNRLAGGFFLDNPSTNSGTRRLVSQLKRQARLDTSKKTFLR